MDGQAMSRSLPKGGEVGYRVPYDGAWQYTYRFYRSVL